MDKYFVIMNSDGDTTVDIMSKETLLNRINEKDYGDGVFLSSLPDNDTSYWGNGVLIIKGDIVTPVAEEVITKYKLD